MPTPSISLPFGLVRRSADSHVRVPPVASLYVILTDVSSRDPAGHDQSVGAHFTSLVHFASASGNGPVDRTFASDIDMALRIRIGFQCRIPRANR